MPTDSDVSLTTGFKYEYNFTADYNSTAGVAQYTACCRFHIGFKCSGDAADYEGPIVSASFVGLLDETAVWNRALSAIEVDYSLFKMPQGIAAREMRADHGVQLDVTLGQVHYGRFNNPCKEGPVHDVSGSPAHDAQVKDFSAFTAGTIDPLSGIPRIVDAGNDTVGRWRLTL